MNPEWVAIYITVVGAAGTALNVWISMRISNSLLKLELRITERFVSKEDLEIALAPMRQNIQLVWSRRAVSKRP